MEKHIEYAIKLRSQIAAMFDEDSENYINLQELKNEDNAKAFMFALGVTSTQGIYEMITRDEIDPLETISALNKITFEICKRQETEVEEND